MTTPRRATPLRGVPAATDPGVFDARTATADAETAYPPFAFIGLDGVTYFLPHVLMLNSGEQVAVLQAQTSQNPEDAELAMRALLGERAPEALAAMDKMPAAVVGQLMMAWHNRSQEDAEGLGEALGRPSPPNRAAKRSKVTSPSGASASGRSRSGK